MGGTSSRPGHNEPSRFGTGVGTGDILELAREFKICLDPPRARVVRLYHRRTQSELYSTSDSPETSYGEQAWIFFNWFPNHYYHYLVVVRVLISNQVDADYHQV